MVAVQPQAERNVLLQSEVLSTSWTLTVVTIQDNVEGTADGVRPTAVNAQHWIGQTYTKLASEAQTWTFRAKIKADGYNYALLRIDDGGVSNLVRASFDVSTGVLAASGAAGTFSLLAAAINGPADAQGYYDCYITGTTDAGATIGVKVGVNLTASLGLEVYTGDGTSRIRMKEAQLRRGLLGTYQATTTVGAVGAFFLMDSGFDFDGVAFTARAERTGLSIIGQTRTGEPKSDINMKKLVTELWPKLEVISGQTLDIYVGMQERIDGPVLWQGPFPYDPATMLKIDPSLEGRLIAVALQSSNRQFWRADGYNLGVASIGTF
jgi:hypothetical protein